MGSPPRPPQPDRGESPDSAESLVRAAASGDAAAAGQIWEAHRGWVRACALAHTARGVDVDDVLQDVALRMWRALPKLREPRRFRPWLGEIARNTARSHTRSKPASSEAPIGEPTARSESPGREDLDDVMTRLRSLPVEYREPLLLKAVEGLAQREIADVLGLTEAAVETRLARGRRVLREAVRRADAPSEGRTDASSTSALQPNELPIARHRA